MRKTKEERRRLFPRFSREGEKHSRFLVSCRLSDRRSIYEQIEHVSVSNGRARYDSIIISSTASKKFNNSPSARSSDLPFVEWQIY